MLNLLLAIALSNPIPSAKMPEPPTLTASATPSLRVRIDKKPNQLQGDFDNDGTPDTLLLVAVDRQLPSKIQQRLLWNAWHAGIMQVPEPLAIYIRHSRDGREILLHARDYFSTPLWRNNRIPMRVVKRGTPEHRRWFMSGANIEGDGIILPTEAGIDILLYWGSGSYRVFYPRETP